MYCDCALGSWVGLYVCVLQQPGSQDFMTLTSPRINRNYGSGNKQ